MTKNSQGAPKKALTLFDSICIIVGIIVGAGIYETAPTIAAGAGSFTGLILLWTIGGLLSLAGALCYAELATTYPEEGGDYVYLGRAYGKWAGFLFAWAQVLIIRPGAIASMCFPFGRYLQALYSPSSTEIDEQTTVLYAALAVVALTTINIVGVQGGKWTQNALTVAKVIGLALIAGSVFFVPHTTNAFASTQVDLNISLALILILFTYGGWNEIAYVAAEVKNAGKNIIRSLLIGTLLVTALYLLINVAFVCVLGFDAVASSGAVATETVSTVLPGYASAIIGVLICVSTLGAANGLIFTGARISYAMGLENRGFGLLSHWSSKFGTPSWALFFQGILSLVIVVWAGSFNRTVVYTTTVVWLFFLATGISVFVLRKKDPEKPRLQRVWGHPLTTIVFCLSCVFLIWSAINYDLMGSLLSLAILGAGLLVYPYCRQKTS